MTATKAKSSGRGSKPGERRGGRVKGTPNKVTAEIKAIAQPYSAQAIETLAQIMAEGESEASRVAAANALLDRAWGKPSQSHQHTGKMDHVIMAKEQRDAAVKAFMRADG